MLFRHACRLWSTCGECVEMAATAYTVFGAFLDAYHESLRAEFPLSVAFFPAMTEDCSLQVRTGADPPGRRRRPSGDLRAPRICPCPCRKTFPGAQAQKYKISENRLRVTNKTKKTSCVRLIWRCFFGPQMEGWIARKPCLTPAHPSSRELNIYTK